MAQNWKSYPLPDPAAVAAKIAAAGGPKIDPTQPSGQAAEDTPLGHVALSWSIASGRIAVTVVSKPWVLGYGTIWEHLDALFA